jgi:phosphatidylglycerol:prolipoprotein diacylglycerol transferase
LYPSIQIGHVLLPTFGIFLWAAVLVLVLISALRARLNGLDLVAVVGAVLAGVAGFAVAGWLFHDSLQRPATDSGTSGDALAAVAAMVAWAGVRRVRLLQLADCLAPPFALFIVLVRVGCFLAGCDFGRPTGHAWGVTYTDGLALAWYGTPLGIPLHPTQLYESAVAMVLFGLLIFYQRHLPPEGMVFSAFAASFTACRFFLGFLRGDAGRGFPGPLSASQWLCILAFAAVLLSRVYVRNPSGGRVTRSEVSSHR